MTKQFIAVDVDDVLSENASAFVAYSNRTWGHNLRVDDFDENWGKMWATDLETTRARADQVHNRELFGSFNCIKGSLPVLWELKKKYSLVVLTSRRLSVELVTLEWIDKNFPGVFEKVYFSGIYDGEITEHNFRRTKADRLAKIGARYLIDDQPKHCLGALECGIGPVLFGEYKWNIDQELPGGITRCKDWQAVLGYFDGQK